MTKTIDIKTPEGNTVDIEVEEFSSLELMIWAGKAPDAISVENEEDVRVTQEVVEFIIEVAESQTILTRELMDELEQEELTRFFNGVVAYAFGADDVDLSRTSGQDYKFDDTIEFNDDGSLDLDDWR